MHRFWDLEEMHGFQTFKTPSKKIKIRYRSFMSAVFQEICCERFGQQAGEM